MLQEAYPERPKPVVRPACAADIPLLVDLCEEGVKHCGLAEDELDREVLARNLVLMLASPDHCIRLFGTSGYGHAFVGWNLHAPTKIVYVPHLYVRPGTRSLAVFDQFITEFAAFTRDRGATSMVGCTMNGIVSPAYDRLWARHGFRVTGTLYERFPL